MNDNNNDVLDRFRAVVCAALRVDPAEVVAEARIFGDLAAESIDILDIQFRVEDEFGFAVDRDAFAERLGEGLSRAELDAKFTVGWCVDYINEGLALMAQAAD